MNKKHTLSQEILGFIAFSAIISVLLFLFLSISSNVIIETYCFYYDVYMDEFDWLTVEQWIFTVSTLLSCIVFTILFLTKLSKHISYIHTIKEGIDHLQQLNTFNQVPIIGNNELSVLANTINEVSNTQKEIKEKEELLKKEKENLIRDLGHDIFTPLTSILSYSDYLINHEISENEQKEYLTLINKKAKQIQELTQILLDGNKRNLEYFENGKLLFKQLLSDFEEELEDTFEIIIDESKFYDFSSEFDIQELKRIFNNLSSNIMKYADSNQPVYIQIQANENILMIKQTNSIHKNNMNKESYRIGINSIKRIVQMYQGSVSIQQSDSLFTISMTFHL